LLLGRYQPPNVQLEHQQIEVAIGNIIQLQCAASGYPAPHVEWTRDPQGLPADAVVNEGYLQFRLTGPQQAGEYKCTASNSAGRAHAITRVVVYGFEGMDRLYVAE